MRRPRLIRRALLGSLAQLERETISDRTATALAYKRRQRLPTSHPPYGYTSVGKDCVLEPVADELSTVEQIILRWRQGTGYRQIARELTAAGVVTKTGRATWDDTTVAAIVRRRGWYADANAEAA